MLNARLHPAAACLVAALVAIPARAELRVYQQYCDKAEFHTGARGDAEGRKYAPSREIDITHQALDVTPDFDRRGVAGTIKIEFKPIARPFAELKLDAVDLTIARVESSAAILGWQNTGEQLVITFKDAIPADTAAWVKITYSATDPQQGLYFRTPAMGYKDGDTHLWTQGEMHEARHWFPSYDYPNERFTTEMICRVKDGMVALSNGKLISQEKDAGTGLVAWHWLQDKPHVNYLVTLCAGYFAKLEDRLGDLPLAYWTPASQIAFARNSFARTKEMVAFFERETGVKYPWARYDQVVVDDFAWGGMENTAQTTLNASTLFPDELAQTRNSQGLIAHELAHQWFGDYVTTKDWSHVWLNEGFATFYDALFREHADGRDEFLWDLLGNARAVLGQQNDVIPIVYREYANPIEQFGFRAYPKGGWILHMLRSQLGPDLYRRCIQTYLERHALGNVTTDDLIGVIEELSGRDWDQFFDQYVYHAHHPELNVSYSWDERSKLAKLSIQQTQKLGPTVLLFHLPLKIRFKTGAAVTDVVANVAKPGEDFYFALPAKPELVRVDPDFGWLAQIEFNPPNEMLMAQLADSSDMIGRVFAVEKLGKRKDKPTVEKLQSVLNTDAFWGVRFEAAKALRQIHNDDARAALLASTAQPEARVRQEVAEGIASFFRPETPAALTKATAGESNPDVRAVAVRALAAYPVEQVQAELIQQLNSTSYQQVLADAAINAIRAQRSPAYLDAVMAVLQKREAEFTSGGFSDGLNTLAVLASDQERKDVFRDFIGSKLNHPKRQVQIAAIRALGTLGDPLAISALQTFATARRDSPQRRAAEAAVRQLRERKPPAAEVGTLRDEVMELQKANRELKQQFDDFKKQLDAAKPAATNATPAQKKSTTTRRPR